MHSAWLAPRSLAGRRGRRVLFAIMRLSKRGNSASVIERASSYDTIGKRPCFGLGNALVGADQRSIRRNRFGPLFLIPDGAYSGRNYLEPPEASSNENDLFASPKATMDTSCVPVSCPSSPFHVPVGAQGEQSPWATLHFSPALQSCLDSRKGLFARYISKRLRPSSRSLGE